jgi:hypothetical protein
MEKIGESSKPLEARIAELNVSAQKGSLVNTPPPKVYVYLEYLSRFLRISKTYRSLLSPFRLFVATILPQIIRSSKYVLHFISLRSTNVR